MKKSLYRYGLLFILMLTSLSFLGQELITGRVIDQQTNEVLPFATVFYE